MADRFQTIEELRKAFQPTTAEENGRYVTESQAIDNHLYARFKTVGKGLTENDFYTMHPEYDSIKQLTDELIISKDEKERKAGVALRSVVLMLHNDHKTDALFHLTDQAKKLNSNISKFTKDDVRRALAVTFAAGMVRKGFDKWKEVIMSKNLRAENV